MRKKGLTHPTESHPVEPLFNFFLLHVTEVLDMSSMKESQGEGSKITFIYHTSSKINNSVQNPQLIEQSMKSHISAFSSHCNDFSVGGSKHLSEKEKKKKRLVCVRGSREYTSQKPSFHVRISTKISRISSFMRLRFVLETGSKKLKGDEEIFQGNIEQKVISLLNKCLMKM